MLIQILDEHENEVGLYIASKELNLGQVENLIQDAQLASDNKGTALEEELLERGIVRTFCEIVYV